LLWGRGVRTFDKPQAACSPKFCCWNNGRIVSLSGAPDIRRTCASLAFVCCFLGEAPGKPGNASVTGATCYPPLFDSAERALIPSRRNACCLANARLQPPAARTVRIEHDARIEGAPSVGCKPMLAS
jgi:hypothetical protein